MSHAQPELLLATTVQVLKERELVSGASLITDWLDVLAHTDGVQPVAMSLQNLRDELNRPTPDNVRTQVLLDELAQYSAAYARQAPPEVASPLQQLSRHLTDLATHTGRA
ncbi:MAG: hypothetical protein H7Z72_23495 [Bacteroidetes bacterium]|nr:hypothetical protein [Fibrella sp.]